MGLVNVEALVVEPPQLSLVINDARMKLTDLVSKLAALYHLPSDADRKAEVLELLGRHRDSKSRWPITQTSLLQRQTTRAKRSNCAVRWKMS